MLHNHEDCHQQACHPQAFVKFFRRERQLQVAHRRECGKRDTCTDASDRHILCRHRKDNPHAKACERGNRAKSKEHAQSGEHTLAATESCKASKAVTQNHQETCDKRHPMGIVRTASHHLGFAQLNGNPRAEEALEQIQEYNGERRFPAKYAERIGESRILGAVVSNVECFSLCDFCDPYRARD